MRIAAGPCGGVDAKTRRVRTNMIAPDEGVGMALRLSWMRNIYARGVGWHLVGKTPIVSSIQTCYML